MANGNGYSAGNLEFSLQTFNKDTISGLDAVISRLETMTSLVGSTSSISKALGTTTGRKSRSGASFNPKDTNKQLKVSSIRLSNILNKVYFIRNYTKQMFRTLTGIVQNAVEYTETLNLWQVAMRGNTEEAEEFIKTMNKGYGIATQTLMQYQAIFKNMLSSLGGLSSDTSYALSEYLTQMAIDYASLYNVSIERAMTTFQSVLSGQVRPIRSIAGYDITETTIYQLYQQLGGTKTMRQLSQTEKRLLRIYAVFQQMDSSGAIGDLSKTMESTANQWRVFTESTKELGTWLGIIFEYYLKPVLPVLNAVTITLTNITKAIAQMRGIKPQEFGVVESVEQLNEELDETQGKLLSFDRFEALNSGAGDDNLLGIDESLLAGLSKYESIMGGLGKETQRLIDKWAEFWFVEGDSSKGLTPQAQDLLNTLESIGITLGVIFGYKLSEKLITWGAKVLGLADSFKLLSSVMKMGIIFSLYEMIKAFNEGNTIMGIVYAFIMGSLVVAYAIMYVQKLKNAKASLTEATAMNTQAISMQQLTLQMTMQLDAILLRLGASERELDMIYAISQAETQNTAVRKANTTTIKNQASALQLVSTAISSAVIGFTILDSVIGSLDGSARTTVSIISMVAGALATVLGIILAIKGGLKGGLIGASIAGLGVGALIAGIKGVATKTSDMSDLQVRKTGGLVEDGIFTMNKGEVMGTFDDGTSIVANNQQIISGIKQGVYSAVVSAMRQSGNGGVGDVYLDGRKVGHTTAQYSHQENVRTGLVKATR